jgi:hypothetical protein
MTTPPTRSVVADALASAFTGSARQRLQQARDAAAHIEALLERIATQEISATSTEVAALEGARLALRMVGGVRSE